MNNRTHRRDTGRRTPAWKRFLLGGATVAMVLTYQVPASANQWGDLLEGVLNQAIVTNAREHWTRVDRRVQYCLTTNYNVTAEQLAQQGIDPDDYRVKAAVEACSQAVAAADAQAAALRRAQEEEQARADAAAERVHRAQADATEAARKAKLAAEADAKARAAEHHRQLVAKYGTDIAAAIEAGAVCKGMTKEALLEVRGNPTRKELIPPHDELWTYGAERIALSNGKVTYIGH